MKKQTKMILIGALVIGLGYYLYNMKHELKEKTGELPADKS
jgi:hypothetical protein